MRSFFDVGASDAFKHRLERLESGSERQWGTMTPAQAVAHLCMGMEQASGAITPPRVMLGRLLGGFVKGSIMANDEPFRRNSTAVPGFAITDEKDLLAERERLNGLIDAAAAAGPRGCTDHPHSFFGRLTPKEWGILMYKHLDHHLRQFGV